MRLRNVLPFAAAGALAVPAAAAASTTHVVRPGESLSSIAAADQLTVARLAAANHLPVTARLLIGRRLVIPSRPRTATHTPTHTPTHTTTVHTTVPYVVRRGDTLTAIATRAHTTLRALAALNHIHPSGTLITGTTLRLPATAHTTTPVAAVTHDYVVAPGDTLSAIAARAGVSLRALAALNHLHVHGVLLAGVTLRVPGAGVPTTPAVASPAQRYLVQPGDTLSAIAARAGITVGALAAANRMSVTGVLLAGATLTLPPGSRSLGQPVPAHVPPYPTPERVSATQVEQIATENGVPASLAAAIGWQESGFNNDLVSHADARGVMQILPRTWSWIQNSLDTGTPLAPASALDNVRGGVLLLRSLLLATHGNAALAAAGYIQGLDSVRRHGMFAVTRQYVANVMALRSQFDGP